MTAVRCTGFLGSSCRDRHANCSNAMRATYLRERLNLTALARRALAWEEAEGAVTRSFVLGSRAYVKHWPDDLQHWINRPYGGYEIGSVLV
jgi:hypothetical protein